ncbi:hypothetical protein, partial [Prolixibacter bellariivorans]|uniref:hypothetical protein n=1 Tax=Prolixibacter bellariivorans TaxID=314319 RepID=UPI001F48A6EE
LLLRSYQRHRYCGRNNLPISIRTITRPPVRVLANPGWLNLTVSYPGLWSLNSFRVCRPIGLIEYLCAWQKLI